MTYSSSPIWPFGTNAIRLHRFQPNPIYPSAGVGASRFISTRACAYARGCARWVCCKGALPGVDPTNAFAGVGNPHTFYYACARVRARMSSDSR